MRPRLVYSAILLTIPVLVPTLSAQPISCETGSEPECFCQFADQVPRNGIDSTHISSLSYMLIVADGFNLQEDREVVAVSWWGGHFTDDPWGPCDRTDRVFSVTIYEDSDGLPGAIVGSYTPATGGGLIVIEDTGETITTADGVEIVEQRYSYPLPEPLALASEDYWLEIIETQMDPCFWVWETGPPGDSHMLFDYGLGGYYSFMHLDFDMAWCLEFVSDEDCNDNGIPDAQDIADGTSLDCNTNGKPDECEFKVGVGCPPDILPGDFDCDGQCSGADIQRFANTFVAGGYTCQADMDQTGDLSMTDVAMFVSALLDG